jgi:hypothetical protein
LPDGPILFFGSFIQLRNNIRHDIAVDIRKPEIATAVIECEGFVIETQKVQDRGVPVVNVDWILNGLIAEFVGGPIGKTAFYAAAGHPD